MKKEWSTGKIIGVIAGGIAAAFILWIAFVVSLFQLICFMDIIESDSSSDYEYSRDYEDHNDEDEEKDREREQDDRQQEDDRNEDSEKEPKEDPFSYGNEEAEEYYDFKSVIRDDLSYQITVDTYAKDDFTSENEESTFLFFDYAKISGDVPNVDGINQVLYGEVTALEQHIGSNMEYLSEGEFYEYIASCYVTCMSEDVLSVVYVVYGYINEDFLESYVVSYNFDMQTGMLLGNTDLINVDDDFSIDFRKRCEKQNGEVAAFSYMSDQQITDYLTRESTLIIFYTPLGMEIGFNYYDGWVTVTYRDYEKFTKQF